MIEGLEEDQVWLAGSPIGVTGRFPHFVRDVLWSTTVDTCTCVSPGDPRTKVSDFLRDGGLS